MSPGIPGSKDRSVDQIAKQINNALRQVYAKEIFIICGKHMQRDGATGPFRFLPGKSKQTLMNDIGTYTEHFVVCCRGVGFNLRITETDVGGVGVDVTSCVNKDLGGKLVERGG